MLPMIEVKKFIEDLPLQEFNSNKSDWRLKLDLNENVYGAFQNAVSALKNMDFSSLSLYPDYRKTVDKLSLEYKLKNENILLTSGTFEAISAVLDMYLDYGEEILSYCPTFFMLENCAKIKGKNIKFIDYDEKFVFSFEKIENNIVDKTKVVYIATPNNPTGELAKPSVVEYLLKKYPKVLFVVDCAYINFSYNATLMDYTDLVKKHDNIAVVKSFSSDFALSGLRFAFVAACDLVIENLKKAVFPYSVNVAALACANAVLNESKRFEEIKELNFSAKKVLLEGLLERGFKAYESEANFIFCDFGDYSDFYYEKLKKHGIIVKNFKKDIKYSSFLRITVPKMGGVKFILELLNKKDVLIFNPDGILFDITNSYMQAIIRTFKHFSGKDISIKEIAEIKNRGNLGCNWETTKALLMQYGVEIELSEIIKVFQNELWSVESENKASLMDREKLLISKETLGNLSERYDLVIFSGRSTDEILYSLKKYEIDKYFYYTVSCDDLPKNMLKPNSCGVFDILKHCPHKTIKYMASTVDDVIAANGAETQAIGIIPPWVDNNIMINNFRHLGVNCIINDIKNVDFFFEEI